MLSTKNKRRAAAATLTVLLSMPLFACGSGQAAQQPAADSQTSSSASDSAGSSGSASGDASGSTSSTGKTDAQGSGDAFDTWSSECVDEHGNVTVGALLGLKGWQLQTLLAQRGFTWNAEAMRYEDGEGRVFLANRYDKDDNEALLDEDEIGQLGKGAAGEPVALYLAVDGYLDGSDDESTALLKAVSGAGGFSCEDYRYVDGLLYALIYPETMERYMALAASNTDGTVSIVVYNEDVARVGALTDGGGAPTIKDVWNEYFGSE